MEPYQEEYIANLKEISGLAAESRQELQSFDAFLEKKLACKKRHEQAEDHDQGEA